MFTLQRIQIPNDLLGLGDPVDVITAGYFEWGYAREIDGDREKLGEDQRREIIRRGYLLYDGCYIPQDNHVSATDIALSVSINSYVVLPDIRRMLASAPAIQAVLEQCPPDVCLAHASDRLLQLIGDLVDDLAERLEKVAVGKLTKVLHKKRPDLIPIVDSYVADALYYSFPWRLRAGGNRFADVLDIYRQAQQSVQPMLAQIQASLQDQWDLRLTPGRVLNYLLWNWVDAIDAQKVPRGLAQLWGSQDNSARRAAEQAWLSGTAQAYPAS